MPYPTTDNLALAFKELEIALAFKELESLSLQAREANEKAWRIIEDIRPALLGKRVKSYGHIYELCQVRVHKADQIVCSGHRISRTGKVGTRQYSLSDLHALEFIDDT